MAKKLITTTALVASVMVLASETQPVSAQSGQAVGVIELRPWDSDPKRIPPGQEGKRLFIGNEFFTGDALEMNQTQCVSAILWEEVGLVLGIDSYLRLVGTEPDLNREVYVVELVRGGVEFVVPEQFQDKVLVRTSTAELQLGHGKHTVAINDDGLTEFQARNGPVKIASGGQTADFGAMGRFLHGVQQLAKIDVVQDVDLDGDHKPRSLKGLSCSLAVDRRQREGQDPGGDPGGGSDPGSGAGGGSDDHG